MQGHSPDTGWRLLAEATVALRAGRGVGRLQPRPDAAHRARPAARQRVHGRRRCASPPAGSRRSPASPARRCCTTPSGAPVRARPLMIGDRLDTDVEGGRAAGMATLLVLTGVSDAAELLAAPPALRPDYVAADLAGLTARPDGPRPRAAPGLGRRRTASPAPSS